MGGLMWERVNLTPSSSSLAKMILVLLLGGWVGGWNKRIDMRVYGGG